MPDEKESGEIEAYHSPPGRKASQFYKGRHGASILHLVKHFYGVFSILAQFHAVFDQNPHFSHSEL